MTEETKATETKKKPEVTDAKVAPAKKVKPPALEDKPFTEFMEQHFTPTLKTALEKQGLQDVKLDFKKAKIPVMGFESNPECWQVIGNLKTRQFSLYFLEENINGQKAFSCTTDDKKPSTIESFMIDERKASLDLMVLFTLKRLNGQKWLARN
ncbi:DUF2996 domain-containing protein [Geminocystis sp. NIES-3709]|uniref:DUF2996 domain-containing protein n=1 Tax=Geminocystis sp. NIES-3709 TaxID=1617448 RepID=UPI0005FC70A5|nr:DUF2996 domain-containing protein [Geminocystis sp. NIES-3709]BAQ65200.1 hypothetical protein GM3709_1965 [Geminocystis sp. NIES-3709]